MAERLNEYQERNNQVLGMVLNGQWRPIDKSVPANDPIWKSAVPNPESSRPDVVSYQQTSEWRTSEPPVMRPLEINSTHEELQAASIKQLEALLYKVQEHKCNFAGQLLQVAEDRCALIEETINSKREEDVLRMLASFVDTLPSAAEPDISDQDDDAVPSLASEPTSPSVPLNYDKPVRMTSRRKKIARNSAVGVAVAAVVATAGAVLPVFNNKADNAAAASELQNKAAKQETEITQQAKPEISAKNIQLGECLDEKPLFSGSMVGLAEYKPMFIGTDGVAKALRFRQSDGSLSGLTVNVSDTPLDVAACVPDKTQRSNIMSQADGSFTVNRSQMELTVAAGKSAKDDNIQTAQATANMVPGLTAELAAKMNHDFVDPTTLLNLSTMAHAAIAGEIVVPDSVNLQRLQATADAKLLASVHAQIDEFYKQQGREAPNQPTVLLSGQYAGASVQNPATFSAMQKQSETIFQITHGQVSQLKFDDNNQTATATPSANGK